MYPATPPIARLSRPKLKKLAAWIRDDLDLLVAREGPNVLRPDDVLNLHETFVALRHADDITVLDLRATGIHRAVQDIAGIATRWPGRLCDDCDKIIAIWTVKFGPLRNIHPFLYGRGGRLEGVASRYEYSRKALLNRWTTTCPGKVHPNNRSHRLGSLGFRAGAWWINPLFAYHAGIIGLESVEGGTSFDKHGAYALLLKDTGEVKASSMERLTYRCLKSDKGKFRLTAATARSRDPIRVLRSHSINSMWGPKAGVRYEGLYIVQGWSIRAAKSTDFVGGEWKERDIIFEIRFERVDAVDMQEVIKRPTTAELDDYSEYKRIRKLTRDGKSNDTTTLPSERDIEHEAIAPPQLQPTTAPQKPTLRVMYSASSRKSLFKRPHFDKDAGKPYTPGIDGVSPMTIPDSDQFIFATTSKKNTLEVPASPNVPHLHQTSDSSPNDLNSSLSPQTSGAGSDYTANTQPHIQEVAPWIDYDAGLNLPLPDRNVTIVRERIISQASVASASVEEAKKALKATRMDADFRGATHQLGPSSTRKHEPRKSLLARSHNPIAKLFDGTKDSARDQEPDDYFGAAMPSLIASMYGTPARTQDGNVFQREVDSDHEHERTSSLSEIPTTPIPSPLPTRSFSSDSPISPMSPLSMARRDRICPPTDFVALFPMLPNEYRRSTVETLRPNDTSTESESSSLPWLVAASLPASLKKVMAQPAAARTVGGPGSVLQPVRLLEEENEGSGEVCGNAAARKMVGEVRALDVKVKFRDPFCEERSVRGGREEE